MGRPRWAFDRKAAVIIGAASGIGLELAKGLAEAGANVVPGGRSETLVNEAAKEIPCRNRGTLAMPCDVTDSVLTNCMSLAISSH